MIYNITYNNNNNRTTGNHWMCNFRIMNLSVDKWKINVPMNLHVRLLVG